jgi:hypothetical protein
LESLLAGFLHARLPDPRAEIRATMQRTLAGSCHAHLAFVRCSYLRTELPMAAQDFNIIDMINEVTDDINNVLGKRRVEEYFTSIVLLYSFIENILVWLVYAKLLWDRAERGLSKKHVLIIRNYCNQLSFHSALQLAFAVRLFDSRIFQRVSKVKEERNRMLHQLWLYEH